MSDFVMDSVGAWEVEEVSAAGRRYPILGYLHDSYKIIPVVVVDGKPVLAHRLPSWRLVEPGAED